MSQTSHGYPLDTRDNADLPRCPMERLADRMSDCPKPVCVESVYAHRTTTGWLEFEITGFMHSPDQIEDLINYLARVKG